MSSSVLADMAYEAPVSTHGVPMGAEVTYLRCTGGAGSRAYVADTAALDLTSQLELVVRVAADDWSPASVSQGLAGKWNATGNQRSYMLRINTDGTLLLWLSSDGTTTNQYLSSVAPFWQYGLPQGYLGWVKVTWRSSDGLIQFFTGLEDGTGDEPTNWAQLGSDRTGITTNLYNSTAPFEMGNRNDGAGTDGLVGDLYRVILRSTIGGSAVVDADFTVQRAGVTSFTESTGKTVTITSPAAIVDDTWRISVEVLVSTGGARVGISKVGVARVSQYHWFDLSPYVHSLEWTRGTPPSGIGPPKMNVGTCMVHLDGSAVSEEFLRAWHPYTMVNADVNNAVFNRELRPGAIMRVVAHKPNASTTAGYWSANTNVDMPVRTDWVPLFTGRVEDWAEVASLGQSHIEAQLVELPSIAGACDCSPVTAQGAGEHGDDRLNRLLQELPYPFRVTWAGRYGVLQETYLSTNYTLQATTMSSNRWQECLVVGDSCFAQPVWPARDGTVAVGQWGTFNTSQLFTTGTTINETVAPYGVALLTWKRTNLCSQDSVKFAGAFVAEYDGALTVVNNVDTVVNEVVSSRVGGSTTYTNRDLNSQSAFGKRSIVRSDLMNDTDAKANDYGLAVVTDWSGWNTATGTSDTMDQTLQPGKVTLTNQWAAQRTIDLWWPVVVDFGDDDDTTPEIRFLGRCTHMNHKIIRTGSGVKWTSRYTMYSLANYKPTA